MPVLYGVFMFMGVSALRNMQVSFNLNVNNRDLSYSSIDFRSSSIIFHATKTSTGLSISSSCAHQTCSSIYSPSNSFSRWHVRCEERQIHRHQFPSISKLTSIEIHSIFSIFLRFWRLLSYVN